MRSVHLLLLTQVFVLACIIGLPNGAIAGFAQEQSADKVYEVSEVTRPKCIYQPDPQYTDYARKKKINGTVLVALIVTPEGTVRDVKVTKSLEKSLDKQAVATVSTWRFEPATKDGKPVAVHVNAEVTFKVY
jgi:TonB family protein